MKAVRVRNGRTHWVLDDNLAYCGRLLVDMPVTRELEAEALPSDEAICELCKNMVGLGMVPGSLRVTLPPSLGTLYTTGPLQHGFRRRTGRRLG